MDPLIQDFIQTLNKRMEIYRERLVKIQCGKVTPEFLHHVKVNTYGASSMINHIATIAVRDSKTLVIKPWDQAHIKEIELALSKEGLNVSRSDDLVLVNCPAPSRESKEMMIKGLQKDTEDERVMMRNLRRNVIQHIDVNVLSKDDAFRLKNEVQDHTDKAMQFINKELQAKIDSINNS